MTGAEFLKSIETLSRHYLPETLENLECFGSEDEGCFSARATDLPLSSDKVAELKIYGWWQTENDMWEKRLDEYDPTAEWKC